MNNRQYTLDEGEIIDVFYNESKVTAPPLLIIGGVHGDEPEGVYFFEHFLHELMHIDCTQLRHFILIPCLNKYGFQNHSRTNRSKVDINRNFPSPDWIATYEKPRYNPGPHPSSEKETLLVEQLIRETSPSLVIHFHSWNPQIVVTGPLSLKEARTLSEATGYELNSDIGYPTPGSLGQFGWNQLNKPVICIEEKDGEPVHLSWTRFYPLFIDLLKGK